MNDAASPALLQKDVKKEVKNEGDTWLQYCSYCPYSVLILTL